MGCRFRVPESLFATPSIMAKAMKAMKAMAAMKAMKAMKKKKITKIARGKMARAVVFRGNKEKTLRGLKQADLIKNSRGKIVSKKASAHAKKVRYQNIKGLDGCQEGKEGVEHHRLL